MPQLLEEEQDQEKLELVKEGRASDDRAGGKAAADRLPDATDASDAKAKQVNLALQGGGAHGAFTWGVLDYLLEDGRIAFEGISATSAGAVNAALCVFGMLNGGREGARCTLRDFWRAVADTGAAYRPMSSQWLAICFGAAPLKQAQLQALLQIPQKAFSSYVEKLLELNPFFNLFSTEAGSKPAPPSRNLAGLTFDTLSSMFSPYYFNPADYNPLKDLLEAHIDFAAVRAAQAGVKLSICATNVKTGKIRNLQER